jgi:hypothetical protein
MTAVGGFCSAPARPFIEQVAAWPPYCARKQGQAVFRM